jgi:hypothetical protein
MRPAPRPNAEPVVAGLPDLTDDDEDEDEEYDEEEDEEEEEGGHYKYKNQSYENGTRDKSNYVALLGPQVLPSLYLKGAAFCSIVTFNLNQYLSILYNLAAIKIINKIK